MRRSRSRSILWGGPVTVVLLAILASRALAASAPTLKVVVKPQTVHPGQKYTITITGSYDKSAVHTVPYLLAFVQYTSGACMPTVGEEYALPRADWLSDFYPATPKKGGLLERSPSFIRIDHWQVLPARENPFLGTRHVCAYLYSKRVALTSTAKPLVKATTTFRAVKS